MTIKAVIGLNNPPGPKRHIEGTESFYIAKFEGDPTTLGADLPEGSLIVANHDGSNHLYIKDGAGETDVAVFGGDPNATNDIELRRMIVEDYQRAGGMSGTSPYSFMKIKTPSGMLAHNDIIKIKLNGQAVFEGSDPHQFDLRFKIGSVPLTACDVTTTVTSSFGFYCEALIRLISGTPFGGEGPDTAAGSLYTIRSDETSNFQGVQTCDFDFSVDSFIEIEGQVNVNDGAKIELFYYDISYKHAYVHPDLVINGLEP